MSGMSECASPYHIEIAVGLPYLPVENHHGCSTSHLLEIGRNSGETVQDNIIKVIFVVGDDEHVLSYLQILFPDALCKGCKT